MNAHEYNIILQAGQSKAFCSSQTLNQITPACSGLQI